MSAASFSAPPSFLVSLLYHFYSFCRAIKSAFSYIDLAHCPIERSWESDGVIGLIKIHPLPLLLAMGNGQGGGDFWNDPHGYVGSWCSDIRDVRVSANRLPGTEDYQEFRPDFTEQEGEPIPWDKEKEFLEKVTAAYRHTKRKTTSKL